MKNPVKAVQVSPVFEKTIEITSTNSALHWAAARGHLSIIEELISNGADPTILTHYGQKPADITRYKSVRYVTFRF